MKAISLWQPFASLMAVGAKTIETRGWPTRFRGELCIHAAKRKSICDLKYCWDQPAFYDALLPTVGDAGLAALPFGALVAVVDVYGCEKAEILASKHSHWLTAENHFGNFDCGRFGWMTRNPRKLSNPVFTRGFQSFWDLPPDVEARVRVQI